MPKATPKPTTSEILGSLAEALEAAAAAVRELEASDSFSKSGSAGAVVDDLVETAPRSGGKAPAGKVAAKSAGSGKKKPPAITFDEVKEKMTDLMNTKGKEVTKSILSEFGVAKLIEVDEASYPDLVAKIDEAVAEFGEEPPEDDDLFGE